MDKNNWELKLHDNVEDPYYEITNGPISLVGHCGFVGETEEEEDAIFKKVADTLNESGIDFHSENVLEFKQHIEIMQLQSELDHWKTQHQQIQDRSDTMDAALNKIIEMNRQHALDQYGDAEKAETWGCVVVAREALAAKKAKEDIDA